MKRVCGVLLVLLLAACNLTDYAWHHEIVVVVHTPNGPVTGRTVQSVEATYGRVFATDTTVQYSLKGEAVTIDLGDGNHLFALIRSPEMLEKTYSDLGPRPVVYEHFVKDDYPEPRAIPQKLMPYFVMFEDPTDPSKLTRLNPSDFGDVLGDGYVLRSIEIGITDKEVTRGAVLEAMPLLESYPSGWRLKISDEFTVSVLGYDFYTREKSQ